MGAGLSIMDDDGNEVLLDADEARCLLAMTGNLEAATVSACMECRSRVIATVAFIDVLDASPPHPRGGALIDLADEAPSLHLYVVDEAAECAHTSWRDPLYDEWFEVVDAPGSHACR